MARAKRLAVGWQEVKLVREAGPDLAELCTQMEGVGILL